MTTVRDRAERLVTVLLAEEDLYRQMRDLLQEERRYIVNLEAPELEECVFRKETLAAEGHLLEESRVAVAAELGLALGLDESRPTLSQLCEALGEQAGDLREVHTRLVALIGAVRELLDANNTFAGKSLNQVRGTLRLLGRILPSEPIYNPGARPGDPPVAGSLVRRSA